MLPDYKPGMAVLDSEGKKVGTLEDVLRDRQGTVQFLVVRDRGFFSNDLVLPASAASAGDQSVHLSLSRDQVQHAARYDPHLHGEGAGYTSAAAERYNRKDED